MLDTTVVYLALQLRELYQHSLHSLLNFGLCRSEIVHHALNPVHRCLHLICLVLHVVYHLLHRMSLWSVCDLLFKVACGIEQFLDILLIPVEPLHVPKLFKFEGLEVHISGEEGHLLAHELETVTD